MTVIGRSKQCQLRIPSTEVSREHCQIAITYDGAFLVDLGSSNGTEVDGNTIKPGAPVKLSSGMRLSIGPADFIVHCEQATGSRTPDQDDSVNERGEPLADTALITPGSIPTRLDTTRKERDENQNWPHVIETLGQLPNTNTDGESSDAEPDFAEWDANATNQTDADASDASQQPDETTADVKPRKPFSLFSLLRRNQTSPSKAKKEESSGAADKSDDGLHFMPMENDGIDVASIGDDESSDKDEGEETLVVDPTEGHPDNDDLDDFLKHLS